MTSIELSVSRRTRPTALTERIIRDGARAFTVYNRMLLPTVFRSLEEDYWHLREHVQLWDVSAERQVELVGPDAGRLMQLMTCRDLSRAVVGQCLYAPLVDQTGGMVNDPILLKLAEDRWWISLADSDVLLWARGLAWGVGLDVQVFEPDVSPLAIQGPKAEILAARIFGDAVREIGFFRFREHDFQGRSVVVARSGWSKQGGFEVYVPDRALSLPLYEALSEAGRDLEVRPGCPNQIERIEGGLLSYGNDFTLDDTPFEAGLGRYVHLDRDIAFIAHAALQDRNEPERMLRGLRMDGTSPPPQLGARTVLDRDGHPVGHVTSEVWSSRLAAWIAIAMLARRVWESGASVAVATENGPQEAVVCDIPFV